MKGEKKAEGCPRVPTQPHPSKKLPHKKAKGLGIKKGPREQRKKLMAQTIRTARPQGKGSPHIIRRSGNGVNY